MPSGTPATPRRSWARPVLGLAVLGLLVWQLGTGPFVDALRLIDHRALLAALAIGVLTTVGSAWRWSLIATGLGLRLPLGSAVAACYRAVFLNSTLPGGVLGDVHRAVSHGRDAGDVSRGVRAVVWERTAGQLVQAALAVFVLAVLPSPVRGYLPVVAVVAVPVVVVVVGWLLGRRTPAGGASRWARALRTARRDVRDALIGRGAWLRISLASVVVVTGYLATFLVAADTAGVVAPVTVLLPLVLLALLAMGIPANIGGFGPREGVAAWAFAAAGLPAAQGVTTALVYGALTLVAALPGAAIVVGHRFHANVPPLPDEPVAAAARPASVAGAAARPMAVTAAARPVPVAVAARPMPVAVAAQAVPVASAARS